MRLTNGEVVPFNFNLPTISAKYNVSIDSLTVMAQSFWQLLAQDTRISSEFKNFISTTIFPHFQQQYNLFND